MIRSYITIPTPVKAVQWTGYNFREIQILTNGNCTLNGPFSDPALTVLTRFGEKLVWTGSWVIAYGDETLEAYSDSDFRSRFSRETQFEHLVNTATQFDREHGHFYVYRPGIGVTHFDLTDEEKELLDESEAWLREKRKILEAGPQ